MNEFRDDQMENLFESTSGPAPDLDAAYERVTSRVRVVRRRRTVVATGALCTLLVGFTSLTIARQAEPQRLQPGNQDSTVFDSSLHSDSTTIDTASPATTSAVSTWTTPASTTATPTPATTAAATAPTVTGAVPPAQGSTPGTQPEGTDDAGIEPDDTAPSASLVTQTFVGVGGRITVRLENDSLTLVSFQAADGFTAMVDHTSGSHVEVRFTSATHETIARVDYDNETMVQRFEEVDG